MRGVWPVAAGIAVGLAAAAIWTWAQPDRYRADARLLVRGTEPSRVMPAVEALAESSLIEQNVAQTLRTTQAPDISAERGEGGVLKVSVEAGSGERARQLDAEAVIILIQTIPRRFEATPAIDATVLDPAHVAEQTSPTPERNFLVAGLAGLAAGIATAFALRRRALPVPVGAVDSGAERRLRKRIEEVAKRERALARRAGELAAREQQLAAWRRDLEAASAPPPPPPPEEVPAPAPAPAPAPVVNAARPGDSWNIEELEARVARSEAPPESVEEWQTYLFFLREHAASDGSLPAQFDSLVQDVFGELLYPR